MGFLKQVASGPCQFFKVLKYIKILRKQFVLYWEHQIILTNILISMLNNMLKISITFCWPLVACLQRFKVKPISMVDVFWKNHLQ